MQQLYRAVDRILNTIDFESIWHGFTKYDFALYDKTRVCYRGKIMAKDERFLGNTAIQLDNQIIAIWKIETPEQEDSELLASNLVHEMFHAFQRQRGEFRFPNDLALLNIPDDAAYFQMKYFENQLLCIACKSKETAEKRRCLEKFMSQRKYRDTVFGNIVKQEFLAETIEGMAEYAGCMALKQISLQKYEEKIESYLKKLGAVDNELFDIRRQLYYSGAIFCMEMSLAGSDIWHEIGKEESSFFEIAATSVSPKNLMKKGGNPLPAKIFEEYRNKTEKLFQDFTNPHPKEHHGNWHIYGYDPMNMVRWKNKILCSHFVQLKNDENGQELFLEGSVMLTLRENTNNGVIAFACEKNLR